MHFLAAGKTDFELRDLILEINPQRYERQPAFDRPSMEFLQLLSVHQQLAFAHRFVIMNITVLIRRNVHVMHPQLAVFQRGVSIHELHFVGAKRFDLGSNQHNADLERIENFVLMARFAVLRDVLDAGFFHEQDDTIRTRNAQRVLDSFAAKFSLTQGVDTYIVREI